MTIKNAILLAAGLGTRLRPITDTTPKPLVKVGGKPMVDHALDTLVAAGIENVVVNVHHFADRMESHLARENRLNIHISDERQQLMNSGGGIAKALTLLDRSDVLVMNSDLFWIGETLGEPGNLTRLGAFFNSGSMDMALLCVALENTTGHNGRNDFCMDDEGRLTRHANGVGLAVVYAGALVMNPALLDDAPADAFNLNIYFDRAIARDRLFGMMMTGHWLTVGTPEAIGEAEAVLHARGLPG